MMVEDAYVRPVVDTIPSTRLESEEEEEEALTTTASYSQAPPKLSPSPLPPPKSKEMMNDGIDLLVRNERNNSNRSKYNEDEANTTLDPFEYQYHNNINSSTSTTIASTVTNTNSSNTATNISRHPRNDDDDENDETSQSTMSIHTEPPPRSTMIPSLAPVLDEKESAANDNTTNNTNSVDNPIHDSGTGFIRLASTEPALPYDNHKRPRVSHSPPIPSENEPHGTNDSDPSTAMTSSSVSVSPPLPTAVTSMTSDTEVSNEILSSQPRHSQEQESSATNDSSTTGTTVLPQLHSPQPLLSQSDQVPTSQPQQYHQQEQETPPYHPSQHHIPSPQLKPSEDQIQAAIDMELQRIQMQQHLQNIPNTMEPPTTANTTLPPPQPAPPPPNGVAPADAIQNTTPSIFIPNHPYYSSSFSKSNVRSTWMKLVPISNKPMISMRIPTKTSNGTRPATTTTAPIPKAYRLSLLNVNEFTIDGVSPRYDLPVTSIKGLRIPIRQICRNHTRKAMYDTRSVRTSDDNNDDMEHDEDYPTTSPLVTNGNTQAVTGKWRIPLSAYHELAGYLMSLPHTRIIGIPANQLQIASLERTRQERGYPDADTLVQYGIPVGLAKALAPFQRGGVDFVREKNGRALIADDMGLGKTIQGVASMTMYHNEWPVLVLCPSGARYHWENEFRQWLGVDSAVNKPNINNENDDDDGDRVFPDSNRNRKRQHDTLSTSNPNSPLLHDWQINVLGSSKSTIFPFPDTKVVICSYGLSSVLIETQKIVPRMFRCAIVDESHMLKNKATKRTSLLLPVLNATDRCVLLSGTPALARPIELWPQLAILGTEQHGWGVGTEQEFMDKYVKNGNSQRSAELHTMLRGTVMIRRLKNDILKSLPRKFREKAEVHVIANNEQRTEFKELLIQLRDSKGVLGKLARIHHIENENVAVPTEDQNFKTESQSNTQTPAAASLQQQLPTKDTIQEQMKFEQDHLHQDVHQQLLFGRNQIHETLLHDTRYMHFNDEQRMAAMVQAEGQLRADLENYSADGLRRIEEKYSAQLEELAAKEHAEQKRTVLLSRLYSLTGDVKVPLIIDTLKRWLADPTKGKVCVFAHHISVLDAIRDGVGLSNSGNKSSTKYIRIDGQTLPKMRQEQINAFQTDSSIRVALLGITAAGVAVTLTASSTVWFAELFWTPAIMIQAEDRCHRIGQNAKVNCLYFVAKGTLDDILWKLLEKKFRDLGEFVEGKEKLKLVVDKTYDGHRELHSTLFNVDPSDEGDSQNGDDDLDFGEDLQFDSDLVHDIEELGEEERRMLQSLETDADEADNVVVDPSAPADPVDVKVPAHANNAVENGLGKSEEDAISLSDDDDEEQVESVTKSVVSNATSERPAESTKSTFERPAVRWNPALLNDNILDDCRMYRIGFCETKLGLEVLLFNGRIVVSTVRPERMALLGPNSKPGVGDILCGIKGHSVGLVNSLPAALQFLKLILQKPPIEFNFIEAPKFIALFTADQAKARHEMELALLKNGTNPTAAVPPMTTSTNTATQHHQVPAASQVPANAVRKSIPDIIELLDD